MRLPSNASAPQPAPAQLGSRTNQAIYQRLIQSTGRFRGRSLSLVAGFHYDYGNIITEIGLSQLSGQSTRGGKFLGEGVSEFRTQGKDDDAGIFSTFFCMSRLRLPGRLPE